MKQKNKTNTTKKTVLISTFAVLFAAILVGGVFAAPMWMSNKGASSDNTAVTTALKNGDYQGYLNAIQANWDKYKASITQNKFTQMSQQYASKSAQIETMQANKKAIDQAITDSSYQEWVTAITALDKKPAFADKITADNFATYVKMYQAEQSKDWTTAQQDAQILGITVGMHSGKGMDFGFGGHRNFMHNNPTSTPASS